MIAEAKIAETVGPFASHIRGEWYKMTREMAISRVDEVLDCWEESNIKLI